MPPPRRPRSSPSGRAGSARPAGDADRCAGGSLCGRLGRARRVRSRRHGAARSPAPCGRRTRPAHGPSPSPCRDSSCRGANGCSYRWTTAATSSTSSTPSRPGRRRPRAAVVEPGFFHRTPTASRDGRLLAYATNRRNGADWDVHVRELGSGEERTVFAEGGWCEVAGFSPDGAVLAVSEGDRADGRQRPLPRRRRHRRLVLGRAARRRLRGRPAGLASLRRRVPVRDQHRPRHGRDRAATSSPSGAWGCSLSRALGPSVPRSTRAGRTCSSTGMPTATRGSSCAIRRRSSCCERCRFPAGPSLSALRLSPRDGRRLAYHFTSPLVAGDVWGRATRRRGESEAADREPECRRRGRARRAGPAPLRVVRRRVRARLPLPAGRAGSVPRRDHDPTAAPRPSCGPSSSPLAQYFVTNGYAVAAPNVRGSAGYGKRWGPSTTSTSASTRWRPRRHPRVAADDRGRPARARCTAARTAATWCWPARVPAGLGRRGSTSSGSRRLVTFLENTSAYRRATASASTARSTATASSSRGLAAHLPRRHRAPLFVIHGANDPRVPLSRGEQIQAAARRRACAASCGSTTTRATG